MHECVCLFFQSAEMASKKKKSYPTGSTLEIVKSDHMLFSAIREGNSEDNSEDNSEGNSGGGGGGGKWAQA